MSWLINIFFKISVKDIFVYCLKNDGNSLHNVTVSWKYKSLLYVIFWLIFKMYHLLILNVIRESCLSNMYICSLIVVNSFFVLYLMCCFGNNPLYMDFRPITILFCSVLLWLKQNKNQLNCNYWRYIGYCTPLSTEIWLFSLCNLRCITI